MNEFKLNKISMDNDFEEALKLFLNLNLIEHNASRDPKIFKDNFKPR